MASAQLALAQALTYLQKVDTSDGNSLYEHLTNVLVKVLEEKPTKVDLIEASMVAKRTAIHTKEASPLVPVADVPDGSQTAETAKLFRNPERPVNPVTGEPLEPEAPNDYVCDNVVGDGVLFDAVGVGLGRTEMYNIMLSVKALGEDPVRCIQKIRFFGKFFGLCSDYYVYECILKTAPKEEFPVVEGQTPVEVNSGSNAFVYLVANTLGGAVTQLGSVTPDQIKKARAIKKFFTGRLSSAVSTYPTFPGTEAEYLRAQISRISSTTVLAPNGLFSVNEDGILEKSEEWEAQPGREMANTVNWVHEQPHMKKQGRCELFKNEPAEDDETEYEPTEEEQEEGPEILAPLEEDTPVSGGAPAWSPLYSASAEAVKNQTGGLKSNLWPGSYAVSKGAMYANVYVGWGLKNAPFVPLPPPPVAVEFDQAQLETQELAGKPVPPEPEEEEAGEE